MGMRTGSTTGSDSQVGLECLCLRAKASTASNASIYALGKQPHSKPDELELSHPDRNTHSFSLWRFLNQALVCYLQ